MSPASAESINRMLHITTQIESIADSCYTISKTIIRKQSVKVNFNEQMDENLINFSELVNKKFEMMLHLIKDPDFMNDTAEAKALMRQVRDAHEQLQQDHFKNIKEGVYKTKVGVIYADIYAELIRIADLSNHVIRLLLTQDGVVHE